MILRLNGDGPAIRSDGTLRPDTYQDDLRTGCRIWLKSMRTSPGQGQPQGWNGTTTVLIRPELWRMHRGTPLTIGAGVNCGNARCVAVAHLIDGKTPQLTLDQQHEIERLAGRLAVTLIAERVGVSAFKVTAHLARQGSVPKGPKHAAARAYAGRFMPDQPHAIDDPYWDIFVYACEHTYEDTGRQFGFTPQGVSLIVWRVLTALKETS